MKKLVLFDLDGTLLDSEQAILASIAFTLKDRGLKLPSRETIRSFIGPPLADSLRSTYKLDDNAILQAVAIYRAHFKQYGMKQIKPYDGIEKILNDLNKNYLLAVATSKPEAVARQLMEDTHLSDFFVGIYGTNEEVKRYSKADVIDYALKQVEHSSAVMIGDRIFDIAGAKRNNIKSIGVLYGIGSEEELTEGKADYIVSSVEEIPDAVDRS